MAKLFVVMATSFEYDDERYHSPECGGGKPLKAFTSEKKANAFATQQTMETLRGFLCASKDSYRSNLMDYAYEPFDIFRDPERAAEILGIPFEDIEEGNLGNSYELTDEQLEELSECLQITFYDVMEVEKG